MDTGINPYHVVFRDGSPRAFAHPSTYLPGYPADATALHLTLDAEDLQQALLADCDAWASVVPGELYWFPGTRIVGAIALDSPWTVSVSASAHEPYACADAEGEDWSVPGTLFGGSHGTMTASRAAGAGFGACPECLVVMVQDFGPEPVRWAAEQPWIDAQSNSWGPFLPLVTVSGAPLEAAGASGDLARAVEEAARVQPSFWASGNGALFRFGVVGHPTQAAFHFGPSAIRVGAHDSGRVATWPGSGPHVVSDGCWSWAAEHRTLDESTPRTGGGTSAATPFAAGLATKLVLEARRALGDVAGGRADGVLARGAGVGEGALADGDLTMDELTRALFLTADRRPDRIPEDGDVCEPQEDPLNALYWGTPVPWEEVPDGPAAVQVLGYGAVTPATADLALGILLGEGEMPDRGVEDAWFAADARAREATYAVVSQAP